MNHNETSGNTIDRNNNADSGAHFPFSYEHLQALYGHIPQTIAIRSVTDRGWVYSNGRIPDSFNSEAAESQTTSKAFRVLEELFQQVCETQKASTTEFSLPGAENKISHFDITAFPLVPPDSQKVVAIGYVFTDISRRKELENENAGLAETIETIQKYYEEILNTMPGVLAHNLVNMVAPASMYLQILDSKRSSLVKDLQTIKEKIMRMKDTPVSMMEENPVLTDTLLKIIQHVEKILEVPAPNKTDMLSTALKMTEKITQATKRMTDARRDFRESPCEASLESTVIQFLGGSKAAEYLLNHGIQFNTNVDSEGGSRLLTYGDTLKELLQELFDNSVRALNDSRLIRSIGNTDDPFSKEITCNVIQENGTIVLQWIDNGCGIEKENIPKATIPFFTTAQTVGPLGLGLFKVKKIVEAHGGMLEITSTEYRGTIVTIKLPLTLHPESSMKK